MKNLLKILAVGAFAVVVLSAAIVGIDCPGHGPVTQITEPG